METDRIATSSPLSTIPTSIEVEISDNQSHLIVNHAFLTGLIRRTLTSQGIEHASISLALVDDATIRAVNVRHLAHDWPTDVISFELSEPGDRILVGELVVSAEMAAATAEEAEVEPRAELALYIVHGLLHLCGLDDQDCESEAEIRKTESQILEAEGLINTFPLVGLISSNDPGREDPRCPR